MCDALPKPQKLQQKKKKCCIDTKSTTEAKHPNLSEMHYPYIHQHLHLQCNIFSFNHTQHAHQQPQAAPQYLSLRENKYSSVLGIFQQK